METGSEAELASGVFFAATNTERAQKPSRVGSSLPNEFFHAREFFSQLQLKIPKHFPEDFICFF